MSFQKFPEYMYEIVVRTGEVELGTYTVDQDGELTNVYVSILIDNVNLLSDERIYLRAIRSSHTGLPITSESILVSDFATGSESWIGNVRFDFKNQPIKASDTLQIFLGTSNYAYDDQGVIIGSIQNFINSSTGQFDVLRTNASYLTLFNDR